MTDNTASHPAPGPQDQPCPDQAPSAPSPGSAQAAQTWEVITFPGQMAITDTPVASPPSVNAPVAHDSVAIPPTTATPPVADAPDGADSPVTERSSNSPASALLHRTEDLIQLIQDLNQCNDALLLRVSDLEESLERSQAALQAEVERNQSQGNLGADRAMMPPQIAQLLSELDVANDGLRRTTIHNETLQTELESSQQRVAQLERECTLLQQRFSEKNTALQRAEDTCRDLKARLHRQQRYTLQFKTALEKCLKANNDQPISTVASAVAGRTAFDEAHPVAMPSAPEIQPWTAPNVALDQADALSSLLGLKNTPASPGPVPSPVTANLKGEANPSWPPLAVGMAEALSLKSFPPQPATEDKATDDVAPPEEGADVPLRPSPAASEFFPVADPWQPEMAEPDPVFTEPSPWGDPLATPEAAAQPGEPTSSGLPDVLERPEMREMPERGNVTSVAAPPSAPAQPAWAASVSAASPKAQPPAPAPRPAASAQRPQRKLQSLAAVQLPSFGRPPRRSS